MKLLFAHRSILVLALLAGFSTTLWADETATPSMSQPTAQTTPTHKKKAKKAEKKKKTKIAWVCPMGDYTGDKPGKCPNCGMDLVKTEVPADGAPSTATGK